MDLRERSERAAEAPRHPWERSRGRFFGRVLDDAELLHGARRVLDVGAGDGWFAGQLAAMVPPTTHIACWDIGYDPALTEALRAETGDRLSFHSSRPDGPFDLILLLDVLEHVEDDAALLRDVLEIASPGAYVLVSVPAWQRLFSQHDTRLGHVRRYAPGQIAEVVQASGLHVARAGGLFHCLLPVRAATVLGETLRRDARDEPAALEWRRGRAVTAMVDAALSVDNLVSSISSRMGLGVPGLSAWLLCRRP